MAWAAVIAGGAALVGGVVASQGAKSAASTQASSAAAASQAQLQAAEESIQAQQQAQQAAQANQQPWINAGSAALSQLGGLLGINIAPSSQYSQSPVSSGFLNTSSASASPNGTAGGQVMGGATGAGGTTPNMVGGPSNGFAGANQLVSMNNGVPGMNAQLYQTNPQYKAAWDAVAAANKAKYGSDYTTASDPNALAGELQQAMGPSAATSSATPGSPGSEALKNLSNLAGWNGADPTAALEATPGYKWALSQGLQGVENSASARGMQLSGATLKDLNNYAQGQASTTYQQQLGNAENLYNTQVGDLMSLAGLGGGAAGGAASGALQTGSNIGSTLTNTGNAIGSNIIGAGNATAAGQVGSSNAIGGALNTAGQIYTMNSLFGNNGGGSTGGTFGPNTFTMPAS